MMTSLRLYFCVALGGLIASAASWAQSTDAIVAEALLPLPEDMRADATVYRHDPETGERIVLKAGTNYVECTPKDEDGFTRCESVRLGPRRDLAAKLEAQGVTGDDLQAALAEAEAAGEIEPVPFGSMLYRHFDSPDRIQRLWVVRLPNATSGQLAMATASQRDNSLAGQGLPWMMREGTPNAHLMIPINGTEFSNPGGATARIDARKITDPIEQAVLPLPDDLKDGAAVIRYNAAGEREVLREGTNMIECQPLDTVSGFIRCYHKSVGPEFDLQAKLEAEGKPADEIRAAIDAAVAAGEIAPRPYAALDYRVYPEDDRIRYLWLMRVPGATPEELGWPTARQRDSALAGEGLPWMMRVGTPRAHLMIPINGTELSN
jgi:hypothetical protein